MARAKYFDGSSYKDWTADMVGGLSVDGHPNTYIFIGSPDGNPDGYYCVARKAYDGAWKQSRAVWMIASRHNGNGLLSIVSGTFYKNTDVYGDIHLFSSPIELGAQNIVGVIHDNVFEVYIHVWDYEGIYITPLITNGTKDLMPIKGDWVETLPSGTQVPVNMNGQQICVQSSAPTDSETVLWIQT